MELRKSKDNGKMMNYQCYLDNERVREYRDKQVPCPMQ